MDDDKLLEELRTQRELIQKHLEWLDRKIVALDSGGEKSASDASDEPKEVLPSPEASLKKGPEEEAPDKDEEAAEKLGEYKGPVGSDIMRAKIGCLVLFVLSTILFLFLLFGLPYLMD